MIVRLMDKYRLYVYEDKKKIILNLLIISVIIQKYKSVSQGQNLLEKDYDRTINE